MPGKYGSPSVTINYDDAPGGTLRALTNFVMELGGAKIELRTQNSHAFGDAWEEHTATGMRGVPPIKMSGRWDTSPGGPHATFGLTDADADPNALPRSLEITFGDGKKFAVETRLQDYEVAAKNGNLTEFTATTQPTGPAVWS